MVLSYLLKIFGTDFSHWNGKIDFAKLLANGVRFVVAKIGEIPLSSKKEYSDDLYARNIREAAAHGIYAGPYYFFHPSIGGSRQARHYINLMELYGKGEFPPTWDVEVADGMAPLSAASVLKSAMDYMAERGYYEFIIYTRNGLWVNQYGNPDWGRGYEYTDSKGEKHHITIWFWMAQYPKLTSQEPKIKDQIIMHQFTDKGRLTGIGVNLDLDNWLKSEEELLALVGEEIEHPAYEDTPEYKRGQKQEEALLEPKYQMTASQKLALSLNMKHGRSEDDRWRFARNSKAWNDGK